MKENTFKKITNITLSTVLTTMPVVSPLTVLADESSVEIDLDETTNSPESPSVENSPLSLETADLTIDSMNDILIDTNFNLEKLESDHADSNIVDEYLSTEENSPSEDETIDKEGEQVFDNSLPKQTVSLQEEKIDSSVLESEETLHEATTHNSSFNLSEWTYTEDTTSITLTKYKGNSTSIYVPGDYQGKQVIIQDFSIFPSSMVDLTLEEMSGKKVGLIETSLAGAFMYDDVIQTLDLSGLDTSNVTDMFAMFYFANELKSLDVSNWNTSNVTNMSYMFSGVMSLTALDVSNWNTSNVTNMSSMFFSATSLKSLDVSNWNTSNVTNMYGMFADTKLTSLEVSNWDTSNVTDMRLMFYTAFRLTSLDVSNWNTSKVTSMHEMFYNTSSLTALDVSNWDTSNVFDMLNMFCGAESLTALDVSNWDTSSVVNMGGMFAETHGLTSLDVSNWNTSNVTNMKRMFSGTTSLTNLDISNWDTSNVTDMESMFLGSSLISLDASNWDTSNVTNMFYLFYNTPQLRILDLTGWTIPDWNTSMFYTHNKTPLLVITQDETLKNYDFKSDNRTGIQLTLDANEGTFSDGTSLIKLPEFYTIDSSEESFIETFILSTINQIEAPTREVHRLEGWSTDPITSTGLQKVLDQLTQTYTANWTSTNQAPVIEVQNQLIHAGEVFNPLDWATVQDAEDGEIVLTDSNIIKNTINSTQAGVYEVTYQVTDRHGLTTEKTIQVRVNALPVIQAQNQVIHTGNSFNPLEWVSASDIEDGEITLTKSNIIKNTINPQVAGVYEVTYQVSDSDGGVVKKTIQVRVNALPVIQTQNQVIHVGEPFEPLNWVTAYDLEDKELSLNDSNIFKNNIDSQTPGVYEVIYRVTDTDGGLTEKTIQVRVNAKPIIEAHNQILFKGEDFNPLNIVKAYDLEDGSYSSNQIHILKNDVNSMTIGVYEVTYQVIDRDGAITQKTIKVVIKDHSIIQEVETPIQAGDTFNPLEWIQTLDLLDDNIIIESLEIIENTVDTSTPGIYEIVYQGITTDGKIVINVIQVVVKDFSLPEEDLDNPDEDIENTPPNEDSDNPNAEDDSPNIEDSKPDKEMIETGFLLDNSFWLGLISLLMGLISLKVKKNK